MAIAIIPIEADPTKGREGWLTMNEADKLVCDLFGVEPDPKWYCNNWFDSFWYFDWYTVKRQYDFESNYAFDGFKTADKAVLHFFKNSIYLDKEKDFWQSVTDAQTYVKKYIEPIIRMFYDKGYKIVSLNLG